MRAIRCLTTFVRYSSITRQLGRPGQGDRPCGPGVDSLLRACGALCYNSMGVCVEEDLREPVESLLSRHNASSLPETLKKRVADSGKTDLWAFAGEGWTGEVRARLSRRFDGDGGRYGFNTASPDGFIGRRKTVLGLEPLTSVSGQGFGNSKVLTEIGTLAEVRGEIVHRGSIPGNLSIAVARGLGRIRRAALKEV